MIFCLSFKIDELESHWKQGVDSGSDDYVALTFQMNCVHHHNGIDAFLSIFKYDPSGQHKSSKCCQRLQTEAVLNGISRRIHVLCSPCLRVITCKSEIGSGFKAYLIKFATNVPGFVHWPMMWDLNSLLDLDSMEPLRDFILSLFYWPPYFMFIDIRIRIVLISVRPKIDIDCSQCRFVFAHGSGHETVWEGITTCYESLPDSTMNDSGCNPSLLWSGASLWFQP